MWDAIGEMLPLAAGIALSPIQLIAALMLVLGGGTPRRAGGFLAGWLIGLTVVVGALSALASALPEPSDSDGKPVLGVIQLALGAALLALAVRSWLKRASGSGSAAVPGWMAAIDTMTPPAASLLGLALGSVNPKVLALSAAAAAGIGGAGLSPWSAAGTIAVFVLLASSTVIAIVIAGVSGGERLRPALTAVHRWFVAENATITAVVFVVFGFLVIGKGIANL